MKTIIFTDTHFGVKQNSITWFKSQKRFIEEQLMPYINSLDDDVKLIHLGDVFDSRSTISTYIATEVVDLFTKLRSMVKEFIIIGGNHDYYSPSTDRIDTLSLLFDKLDIQLVTKYLLVDGEDLYLPWYEWLSHNDRLRELVKRYGIKNIYTHADIVTEDPHIPTSTRVYSGHMHTPKIFSNLYNLGSCYYLNFGDSDGDRGFYMIDEENNINFIKNTSSIKFWRFYNEDILNLDYNKFKPQDYFELYITQENLQSLEYSKIISDFIDRFKNSWVIPQYSSTIGESNDLDINKRNIEQMIQELVPENLKEKFNKILEHTKTTDE